MLVPKCKVINFLKSEQLKLVHFIYVFTSVIPYLGVHNFSLAKYHQHISIMTPGVGGKS